MKIMRNNNNHQTLVEELVKQRLVLTEEEMKDFCTFEEIITDAKLMFDKKVKNIIQKYDNCKD